MSEALDHLTAAQDALARLRTVLEAEPVSPPYTAPEPVNEPAPALTGLAKPAAFFDYVRTRAPLGPSLSAEEVAGCEAILQAAAGKLGEDEASLEAAARGELLGPREVHGQQHGQRQRHERRIRVADHVAPRRRLPRLDVRSVWPSPPSGATLSP